MYAYILQSRMTSGYFFPKAGSFFTFVLVVKTALLGKRMTVLFEQQLSYIMFGFVNLQSIVFERQEMSPR